MGELNLILTNTELYVLVMARMAGIFAFNPLLSRNTIPAMVRSIIVLAMTLMITPILPVPEGYSAGTFDFLLGFGKEVFIGLLLGYVFNVFYYMLLTAADYLDITFGFAMAKVLDPATNIQSAFTANILNMLFIMYFFVTNSHLTLIKTAVDSYDLFPIGAANLSVEAASRFAINLFENAFGLAIKLAFPFIAVELIIEISMGILMKLIPQIHIFIIHVQIKIITALVLLLVLANPISVFIDNYILIIFDSLNGALNAAAG